MKVKYVLPQSKDILHLTSYIKSGNSDAMVYPDSPFTDKFNINTIITLNSDSNLTNKDNIVNNEEYNLPDILRWLCTTPKLTSFRVNTIILHPKTAKKLLENQLKLVAERQGKLDFIPKITHHEFLEEILLVDSYPKDILDLNKRKKEIIIDAACGTAVLRGANIFTPGVLAMQNGVTINDTVSIYVDLSKNCRKGFAKIYECPQKLFIANGIVKMTRKELFNANEPPRGIAIYITDTLSGCPAINEKELPKGTVLLQNIPSIICGQVLNPKPCELILDMCAAPGNKTSHLSALSYNEGKIVALDKHHKKLMAIYNTREIFELRNVEAFSFDATKSCNFDSNPKLISDNEPPYLPETFDKILLDAPCSGLGNRPQLLNKITDTMVKSFVPIQKKLFRNAAFLLKKGGYLVYSTCTITLAENEGIVAWALKKFDFLELVTVSSAISGPGWPGAGLTKEQLNMVKRFGPGHEDDSIGFFIAKFKRKL